MGGYGGQSNRLKEKCYYDTGGRKVTDKHAIEVAEYYIRHGKYVAFLREHQDGNRADLSVEGVHVEVKGITSLSLNGIEKTIKHAHKQVHGDDYRYPPETYRQGKIIFLSKHSAEVPTEKILEAMTGAVETAIRKGYLDEKVEVWIKGKIYTLT